MTHSLLSDIDTLVPLLKRLCESKDPRVQALLDFHASGVNDAWELRFDMQSLSNDMHEEAERELVATSIPAGALVEALSSMAGGR